MIQRRGRSPANNRGWGLVQLLLGLIGGTIIMGALLAYAQTLMFTARSGYVEYEGMDYAIAPSTAEGLKAVRYHHLLMKLRQEADMVFSFGGEAYVAKAGGDWWHYARQPLRMGLDWEIVANQLENESPKVWFYRLAGCGSTQFFDYPQPLFKPEDYESNANKGSFTLLFLRGKKILGVAQVRLSVMEAADQEDWWLWDCRIEDRLHGEVQDYRCAWREGEIPLSEPVVKSLLDDENGRYPGVRELQLATAAPIGARLCFNEVIFPDPLQIWGGDAERGATGVAFPVPRFSYLFFIN